MVLDPRPAPFEDGCGRRCLPSPLRPAPFEDGCGYRCLPLPAVRYFAGMYVALDPRSAPFESGSGSRDSVSPFELIPSGERCQAVSWLGVAAFGVGARGVVLKLKLPWMSV